MKKPVWIFLQTSDIGGAEKRFFGLWQALQHAGNGHNVKMVCSPALYQLLEQNPEFSASLQQFPGQLICADVQASSFGTYRKKLATFIHEQVKETGILHFIGDHPLMKFKGMRQVYSITQSSLANLNMFGKIGQYGGIFFADRTDILDPGIAAEMKKSFFYKKSTITQTASSFCDTEIFNPVPPEQKKDWIVFLGRFEPMKQVVPFVQALPEVYKRLKNLPLQDLRFYLLGHGSQQETLNELLTQDAYKDLPVTIGYEKEPQKILNQSAIFVSLQLHNNYPSKSLLEGMAAGNIPLVTDVGETRWIAKPEFSAYVPEHFSSMELADAIENIFEKSVEQRKMMAAQARELVRAEHTIDRMRDYYQNIYNKL